MATKRLCLAIALAVTAGACATTSTEVTTWTAPQGNWTRPGHVESVREIVQRTQGDPGGGALAGALIGGLLFHGRHGPSLFGAVAGAAVGAAASQGTAEYRSYEVLVRFDDGDAGVFVFRDFTPFRPGEPVVLTPSGLMRP